MRLFISLSRTWTKFDQDVMAVRSWNSFIKALALVFLAYWWHLGHGLPDWLGSQGFHLESPASKVFGPLPSSWPLILWWITLAGGILMLSRATVALGCAVAGCGFFYATICDPASTGALNMNFLFAIAVIFWSTRFSKVKVTMSAWPAYLIRLYLVVVYFGSGWRKTVFGDWLSNPDALLHCTTGFYTTNLTRYFYPILPHSAWTIVQYGAVTFELGAPLLLLYPPLKKSGVILGCLLHVGIALLMKDLFYFSIQMLTFYIPVLIATSHLDVSSPNSGHQSAI